MRDSPTRWDCDPYNEYSQIGLHWLAGTERQMSPHPSIAYLNWRTGETGRPRGNPDGLATFDLDDPRLGPATAYAGPAEGDARVVVSEVPGDPILLRRRGRRSVVLSRCRTGCSLPGLAGGRVVWREGRREVRAYVLRTGRRWSWRLPVPATGSWSEWTITTRWATLVTVHGDRGNPAYVIPWAR
jgi:hypothetical protein